KVEVAIVVEVCKSRGGGDVTDSRQPDLIGDVLEGPVAPIAQKNVSAETSQEQVRMSVVVEISHGHTQPIASALEQRLQTGIAGHVLEGTVALIAAQTVVLISCRVKEAGPRTK